MALMDQANAISKRMADEAAKGSEMDLTKITAAVKELGSLFDSDEAKGYAELPAMKKQLEKMTADIDGQAKALKELHALGLRIDRSGDIAVPAGLAARRQMMADGRSFVSRKDAEAFGGYAAVIVARGSPNRDQYSALPRRALEIYEDVVKQDGGQVEKTGGILRRVPQAKAGDIDPNASGIGAELVAAVYVPELIRNVEAVGTVFPKCRRVPLATLGVTTFPRRTGGLTCYWTAFGTQILQSGMTFDTVTLQPKELGSLTAIPSQMLTEPGLLADLGNLLGIEIAYAFANTFDDVVVNSDGTAGYGNFTGILHGGFGASTSATGHTTAALLDYNDVGAVVANLPVAYALPNASWSFHNSVRGTLRNIRSLVGTPLYERAADGQPSTVEDYPYAVCTRCPTKTAVTAGTPWGIFGDHRLAYFVGMLRNLSIAASDAPLFAANMTAVRGLAYVSFEVADTQAVVIPTTHG